MSLAGTFYNITLKRTSTYVLAVMLGAFVFERAFDQGVDSLWGSMNRGVCVLVQ